MPVTRSALETPLLRRLLTLNETAEALRKKPSQLRWMIQRRTAPPHAKIGGRLMWDADQLAAWLDTQFSSPRSNQSVVGLPGTAAAAQVDASPRPAKNERLVSGSPADQVPI
ncbi:helix-turn-helix transcriptional regulator [Curtobacterium salicis]|uniref:helix-turn-helix transcriptional regulator n=1 Tax=Curtobacterium salicis TaxID=1779862 RepID=UPI00141A7B17|nr:helix-turn-helix domain-containing protein [Curtobacterium sp. WW7]